MKHDVQIKNLMVFFLFMTATSCGLIPLTPKQIAKKVMPSVVVISTKDCQGNDLALGSGFFIESDLIVTNVHVMKNAFSATAKSLDENVIYEVTKVIGFTNKNDLCVLKLKNAKCKPLKIDADCKVEIGDQVYAAGNPHGLEGSLSKGIVSAVRSKTGLFQIDAPISPGSSGGPLVNSKGNVIGIIVSSLVSGQNLNFAVPVKYLKKITLDWEIPISNFGFDYARNGLDKEHLKGPVKSIISQKEMYHRSFEEYSSYNELGDILAYRSNFVDEYGNKDHYDHEYEYDKDGLLAFKTIKTYDENGELKESLRVEFKKQDKKPVKIRDYNSLKNEHLGIIVAGGYDTGGGIRWDCQGQSLEHLNTYNLGNKILIDNEKYTYTPDGLISEIIRIQNDLLKEIVKFEYEYDNFGNWTSRTTYVNKGAGFSADIVERRKINYYEQVFQ
ncbi:MAG TPA: S1C family serine protease [Acidobacteriota bacterium]|nr:S1C family serine protease [Acidobacteriota bacterium]HNT16272.1 S1C family serine protease [Acidobacteriota bacterium]